MAATAALAGVVLYGAQPVLAQVASSLGAGAAEVGLVSALAQAGFGAGLVLLVPLADLLDRRRLVAGAAAALGLCAAAAAVAPTAGLLLLAALALGALAVVGQVLVPVAAGGEGGGRPAAWVGGGLLAGLLAARTAGGLVAGFAGWRVLYGAAAACFALLALALVVALRAGGPAGRPERRPSWRATVRSVAAVPARAGLRGPATQGALAFAAFGALWTALPFLLGGPGHRLGPALIGLFGLTGVLGLAGGAVAGRLARRSAVRAPVGAFVAVGVLGWALLEVGRDHLGALAAGLVLLDAAVQGIHVSCQAEVAAAGSCSASLSSTGCLAAAFLGGGAGSALSGLLWAGAGWGGVCALGLGLAGAGLCVWIAEVARGARVSGSGALAGEMPFGP